MPATCNVTDPYLPTPICCAGGKGTLLGAGLPFPPIDEFTHPAGRPVVALSLLALLLWTFMGVALAADVFMAAIEEVTSLETTHVIRGDDGQIRRFRAHGGGVARAKDNAPTHCATCATRLECRLECPACTTGAAHAECVVCLDGRVQYAVVPCGHYCVCAECHVGLTMCPICRGPVKSTLEIFDVS